MNKKESKSLKVFKNGFKKNEIIIYAIALMLVTAGYFNYTAENAIVDTLAEEPINDNSIELSTSDENSNIQTIASNDTTEPVEINENNDKAEKNDEDIGDAQLVSNNSIVNIEEQDENKNIENQLEVNTDESDYFASSKLQRDTNYADMISTYKKILEDGSVSETQKSIAMKEITKINEIKNAISICENLLSTKDFKNFVVFVNNDSINVVVQCDNILTKSQVAQIQNIVSREFNSKIEDIHITSKK